MLFREELMASDPIANRLQSFPAIKDIMFIYTPSRRYIFEIYHRKDGTASGVANFPSILYGQLCKRLSMVINGGCTNCSANKKA